MARFDLGEIHDVLRFLHDGPDLQSAGPGDRRAADRIRADLTAAGYALTEQAVTVPAFAPGACEIRLSGVATPVIAQAHVRLTGPDGVTAPLRIWRDPSDTPNMAGAIAVIMLPPARHSRLLSPLIRDRIASALQGDPAAVVLITDGPTGETIYLNAPASRDDMPCALPLAVLGPKPAEQIIEAARARDTATLVIDGVLSQRTSHNIAGAIERGPRWIVVSTPRTGWTRAVAERGPGLAAFLAIADHARAAFPRHSLLMLSTTAHEYDNLGSHAAFDGLAPDPATIALWVHLGAGFAARDFHEAGRLGLLPLTNADSQRYLLGSEPLLPVLREAFSGLAGLERPYPASAGGAGELAEIIQRGYQPVFGMYAAHRYHHIDADDIDKTDPALVAGVAEAVFRAMQAAVA